MSLKLRNMKELTENKGYTELVENIGSVFNKAKNKIIFAMKQDYERSDRPSE